MAIAELEEIARAMILADIDRNGRTYSGAVQKVLTELKIGLIRVLLKNMEEEGVLEMESNPPFKVLRWTRRPLWKASIPDFTTSVFTQLGLKRLVTFPTHLEICYGQMFILAGKHDYTDQIITLDFNRVSGLLQ